MTIELLHRGRFVVLAGATARKVAGNAWTVQVPLSDAVRRQVRGADRPESWDGVVFALDGRQTEPAIGSGATDAAVTVTVVVL